jgi:LacI family transcriptional regulator
MATPQIQGRRTASRVTIADVADACHVSPTTVSHVLSGKRAVGAATRARVETAIRELGYRPSSAARQLRTKRSHMVAVVVPDITNPFYSVLIRGLADAMEAEDCGTYVCNTDGLHEREHKFLCDVVDRGVDGIVIASVSIPQDNPLDSQHDVPVVRIGGARPEERVDLVTSDAGAGARDATAHLIARGAQRVAMIQGPREEGVERTRGYVESVTAANQEVLPALMVHGDWTRAGGRVAMHRLMALSPRPDAVFCANDLMAIGAMDAIHELGAHVPGDVALMGFDDVDAATIVTPALSTVRNPAYETGQEAGRLLISRVLGTHDGQGRTVVLPCPLVHRAST